MVYEGKILSIIVSQTDSWECFQGSESALCIFSLVSCVQFDVKTAPLKKGWGIFKCPYN